MNDFREDSVRAMRIREIYESMTPAQRQELDTRLKIEEVLSLIREEADANALGRGWDDPRFD